MPSRANNSQRCPACGARVPPDAALCPRCGAALTHQRQSEQCPSCGARMLPGEDHCPICGAHREVETPLRLSVWTIVLGALALVALGIAVLLLQPKPEVVTTILPTGTPTATVTITPTRTLLPSQTPLPTPSATASDTPTSTPTATPEYELYTTKFGDTLVAIARKYGITVDELRRINGLKAGVEVVVGQELAVPQSGQAATPTAAVTSDPNRVVHVVQQGENLLRIAAQYGVPLAAILEANDLTENSVLDVGQELIIKGADPAVLQITPSPTEPQPITHVVVSGDNLGKIALQYGVDEQAIAQANGITSNSILSIGQKLTIPQTVATPEATATPEVSPTETPTLTETPTITPIPSPTYDLPATPTIMPVLDYPQPLLLAPTDRGVISGETSALLNWTSSGILDEDEWYLVRVWYGPERTSFMSAMTQSPSLRLSADLYPGEQGWPEFYWQVVVVRQQGQTGRYKAVSPESAVHSFNWR